MTLSLENTEQLVLQRRDATWPDYVAVRDGAENWRKIAFHQGGYGLIWAQKDQTMLPLVT